MAEIRDFFIPFDWKSQREHQLKYPIHEYGDEVDEFRNNWTHLSNGYSFWIFNPFNEHLFAGTTNYRNEVRFNGVFPFEVDFLTHLCTGGVGVFLVGNLSVSAETSSELREQVVFFAHSLPRR